MYMNYEQQLQANRLEVGITESPMMLEWKIIKEQKYPYDPCYDYAQEVFPRLQADLKRDGFREPETTARSILFAPPEFTNINKHKTAYWYWIDYKYSDYKRNWKPKDTDGLNYMWLTFNFSPDVSIQDIQNEISRIINLPIFKSTTLSYVYEYYTEHGGHPHVHMLVEFNRTGTISISTLKQVIFQKKALKSIMNLSYKMSWSKDYKDRTEKRAVYKLGYLLGKKIESKLLNCEKDKEYRKINNLEQLYIKENK